jgi:hypothetical protein
VRAIIIMPEDPMPKSWRFGKLAAKAEAKPYT